MEFQIGQKVQVMVRKHNHIISEFNKFEDVINEDGYYKYDTIIIGYDPIVIGPYGGRYFCLLVDNPIIEGWDIKTSHLQSHSIDSKYLGKRAWTVEDQSMRAIQESPNKTEIKYGYSCLICREWSEWAIANQTNGSFACYKCRTDPRNCLER